MEKALVIALLEKYWQTETTVAEEQALADYFRGDGVDAELEPYRDLFAYFNEEAAVSAGPDFGDRILRHLGLPADGEMGDFADSGDGVSAPVVGLPRRGFGLGLVAAAAAIGVIFAGLFLLTPRDGSNRLAETTQITRVGVMRDGPDAGDQVKDTYDDPEKALAAVRRALLVASTHLNESRRQLVDGGLK